MAEPGGSLHVVFGATGAIGGAVVGELVRAGRSVRAVSRGGQAPEGARGVAADASDPAQAARVAGAASVIYHCASPPYTRWPELFPALTSSILGAAESSGAKLVFADNLYAYGPVDGPLREDLPAAADCPHTAAGAHQLTHDGAADGTGGAENHVQRTAWFGHCDAPSLAPGARRRISTNSSTSTLRKGPHAGASVRLALRRGLSRSLSAARRGPPGHRVVRAWTASLR